MSGKWNSGQKRVPVEDIHVHEIDRAPPPFFPPTTPQAVAFTPEELAISISRNLALKVAEAPLLEALARSSRELVGVLVNDQVSNLEILPRVSSLGDAGLSHFAHDLSVGIAGLLMEAMGYAWHANGKELLGGRARKPDYVWTRGTSEEGVVLSEAKGSAAVRSSKMSLNRRAEEGFENQICPWIGKKTIEGSDIVWGYGIGVYAPGGGSSCCVVHEPKVTSQVSSGRGPFVPLEIARGNYAAAFRLMGCSEIALSLEARLDPESRGQLVEFKVVEVEGKRFLLPRGRERQEVSGRIVGRGWRFGLLEDTADAIFNYKPRDLDDPDSMVIAPLRRQEGREVAFAPDGLALMNSDALEVGYRVWRRDGGLFGSLD